MGLPIYHQESETKAATSFHLNKLMTNKVSGIRRVNKVKGQKFGTVTSYKYLAAIV